MKLRPTFEQCLGLKKNGDRCNLFINNKYCRYHDKVDYVAIMKSYDAEETLIK